MVRLNEEVSEIIGVLIGDGCISRYKNDNRFTTVLLFTGSWKNDSKYYKDRISKLMLRYFGKSGNIYHRKDDDTVRHSFYDRSMINYFISLGFPVGKKTEIVRIPKQIYNSKKLSIACVRGIFHTDGSVYSRYSKKYISHSKHHKNYAVVQFKMKNYPLIEQIKHVLNSAGIKTTKIGMADDRVVVRITDQKYVDSFFSIFKISHPHHLERYHSIRSVISPKVADS